MDAYIQIYSLYVFTKKQTESTGQNRIEQQHPVHDGKKIKSLWQQ